MSYQTSSQYQTNLNSNNSIDTNLQFYNNNNNNNNNQPSPQSNSNAFYSNRNNLDNNNNINNNVIGTISSSNNVMGGSNFNSNGQVQNWWNAFTPWTGLDGEPPLLEELGINFDHILQKSLTVLNPLSVVDVHIMDDADLAGPLVFCFVFATLLLVSGKPQFSYIYGVALVGSTSIYFLLNLMSESGIDAYRTASVLGYCLLPLVLLSMMSIIINLDGTIGYLLSALTIFWCSYSASSIFSSVLRLSSQRFLVAYPVALFFAAFALLSVFDGKTGGVGVKS